MKAITKEEKEEISENFSEKKKRGRPRLWHQEYEEMVRQGRLYCDIRTLQNEHYLARATNVLRTTPNNSPDFPFAWLIDSSNIEIGKSERRGFKKTILSELGRIKNNKNLIEAATEICQLKPKANEAVKLIRGWRLRRIVAPILLESAIQKTIDDYRRKNQEISDSEIYETLCSLEEKYLQEAIFRNQESR